MAGVPHQRGDFISPKYEVLARLGQGGFGVVYLVYSHETKEVYALKSFRDEYLADAPARKRFRREAQVWVDLERHPYIVRAFFVDEVAGRLYIGMEHIAPDEQGLNTLEGYLQRRPPDLAQSLRWAIQLCHGMEYAYSRGIRCHRDIKPANILISQDRTVKIADFGLAGVAGAAGPSSASTVTIQQGVVGLSMQTGLGAAFGTPTHMPPEQFANAAACDERSDIYAFGVVLYQMVTAGRLPFLAPLRDHSPEGMARFWLEMEQLHRECPVPRLDSPLSAVIGRCLEKDPAGRYQRFRAVRSDLEPLLKGQTGEVIRPPEASELQAWEWTNKGISLAALGRPEEAIRCYDEALRLDPRAAVAWSDKGNSLAALGRLEEAMRCYDEALRIDPRHANAWNNKGNSLAALGHPEEAIPCWDEALRIDPRHANAWSNKGTSLGALGRPEEAIRCYDEALRLDPRDAVVWLNKGNILAALGLPEEAIRCHEEALLLDPRDAAAWSSKGNSLAALGQPEEAIRCYDEALRIDPRHANAWSNKGTGLATLGRHAEAIPCWDEALRIDPRHTNAWYNKALAQDRLGSEPDAADSYRRFLEVAGAEYPPQAEHAGRRLRELERR